MELLRPNAQRANTAILLIWIVFSFEILTLMVNLWNFNVLNNQSDTVLNNETDREMIEGLLALMYAIAYIVSTITFIRWFRRAYFILHLQVDNLSHKEVWAAGAWFLPISNLYKPFQIMKELYVETIDLIQDKLTTINLSEKYLGWWWALWIINNVIGQIEFRLSNNANTNNDKLLVAGFGVIANMIGIPLALITIKIIRDYSSAETILLESSKIDDEINKIGSNSNQ